MFGPTITRLTRLALALVALTLAVTAIAPATSGAATNQGGGTGNSEFCKTLRDRLKRYHDIATNPNEPPAVRDFYRVRADVVLTTARQIGCSWATAAVVGTSVPQAGVVLAPSGAPVPGACDASCRRQRARFGQLTPPLRRPVTRTLRRAVGSGATGSTPQPQTTATAVKAHPSGNPQQDDYCSSVAKLITEAQNEADQAVLRGDQASADAWYDLADYFIDEASQRGCRFVFLLKAGALRPAAERVVATKG